MQAGSCGSLFLALGLVLAGCGRVGFDAADGGGGAADAVVVPSWSAGTRLQFEVADWGSGAKAVRSWYDSELAQNCSPVSAADGSERCMPGGAGVEYLDAACTQPMAIQTDTRNVYAVRDDIVQGCGNPIVRRAYLVGAEIQAPAMYYSPTGGSCTLVSSPPPSFHYFAVSAELPPETFVATHPYEAGSARLHGTGRIADDGAWELTDLFDTQIGEPCVIEHMADGDRCVPTGHTGGTIFADPACTQPIVGESCDAHASYAAVSIGCLPAQVYELGPPFAGTAYWHGPTGACVQSPFTGLYGLGAEVSSNLFELGANSAPAGGDRIATFGWLGAGGTRTATGLYDRTRAEACGEGFVQGDGVRCYPTDSRYASTFADPACARPTAKLPTGCELPRYVLESDPRGFGVHEPDPAAPTPTESYMFLSSCIQLGVVETDTAYVTGAAATIPATEFAPATVHVE